MADIVRSLIPTKLHQYEMQMPLPTVSFTAVQRNKQSKCSIFHS